MADDLNALKAATMAPEAEEATEGEGAVSEALEALNSMAKRGLISPEQYQATLARLGESTEAEQEPEAEDAGELTGAGMAAGLKAVLPAEE